MYQYKTLSNGIRIVAEKITYLKSISIGIWIGNGSRYESKNENGISHFIEHMLFKGTQSRSGAQIAGEIDAVGGQLDAFTTREYTCFYTKTLDEHIPVALDVLSDMLHNPRLDEEDLALERQVVKEEIRMYEDSPEDLVYDMSSYAVWGDTPMGRTILGTYDSLDKITPDIMRAYMHNHYTSANTIISVSGNFDENFFDLLEKYFGADDLAHTLPSLPEAPYLSGRNIVPVVIRILRYLSRKIIIITNLDFCASRHRTIFDQSFTSQLSQIIPHRTDTDISTISQELISTKIFPYMANVLDTSQFHKSGFEITHRCQCHVDTG